MGNNEERKGGVIGYKIYKSTDYLVNVRATFSDKRLAELNGSGTAIEDYKLDVTSFADYFAFGMLQPGRNFNSPDYRFGFNGMEKDDEIKGITGSSYDFGARMYDPRVGRWLSLDPLQKEQPAWNPYNAFNDNPIVFIDPDGRDAIAEWEIDKKGRKTLVIKANYHYIKGEFEENVLSSVKAGFNRKWRGIKMDNEKIKVRFELDFIGHDPGTNLEPYDGTNGENRLVKKDFIDPKTLEQAYYEQAAIDPVAIEAMNVTDETGKIHTPNKEEIKKIQVSVTSHGVAHNIGMIHADEFIMNKTQNPTVVKSTSRVIVDNQPSVVYYVNWPINKVNKANVQNLVNRINNMTKQGRQYWPNRLRKNPKLDVSKDAGITTMKRTEKK